MPCKVCINKCCFKWIFIDYFSLSMSINYESIYQSKLSMISLIIHNSIIDGQYLCEIVYDHCIYVYKKPIIIIEHRFGHKFQMCKEDGFTNFKFDYTWQHNSLTKLGFMKSANPKCVIF